VSPPQTKLLLLLSFTFVVTRKLVTQNLPNVHFVVYLFIHFISLFVSFLLFITIIVVMDPSSGPEDGLEIPIVLTARV